MTETVLILCHIVFSTVVASYYLRRIHKLNCGNRVTSVFSGLLLCLGSFKFASGFAEGDSKLAKSKTTPKKFVQSMSDTITHSISMYH